MMTELRLVTDEPAGDGPFSTGTPLPRRLPPGRHGIPANLVTEHQRRRLLAAMAEALAEQGYAGVTTTRVSELAGVSTSTFYKHFGNLWDCALAAYVATSDRLCAAIEHACAECDPRQDPLDAGVEAALAFCAGEPAGAQLLSAHAPLEASAIAAARRILISRLAAMLRRGRGPEGEAPQPPGLDERLIDATFTFVASRISAGGSAQLADLAPELTTILSRPRRAA
jgi:AcrR family transcriptional regulator